MRLGFKEYIEVVRWIVIPKMRLYATLFSVSNVLKSCYSLFWCISGTLLVTLVLF